VSSHSPTPQPRNASAAWGHRFENRKLLRPLVVTLSLVALSGALVMGSGPASAAAPPSQLPTFETLAPGSPLPSGRECAARVIRSPWEPRPQNWRPNHRVPRSLALPDWDGVDPRANELFKPRITGRFRGTTDEIIQWGSCKWGIDTDVVRAMAVIESLWVQHTKGDITTDASRCPPGYAPPCPTSFGLLQIKHDAHPGTFPHSLRSTAFNVDYGLAVLRVCYEGWLQYAGFPEDYQAGDLWGCVGFYFAGAWRTADAEAYIAQVQEQYATKPWLEWEGCRG
jgi:hypothetical protein